MLQFKKIKFYNMQHQLYSYYILIITNLNQNEWSEFKLRLPFFILFDAIYLF